VRLPRRIDCFSCCARISSWKRNTFGAPPADDGEGETARLGRGYRRPFLPPLGKTLFQIVTTECESVVRGSSPMALPVNRPCYTPPNMELSKKRRVLGVLPFGIGMVTALVALESVSDPNTRHAVAAVGLAVAVVGLVVMFRTIRSTRS